MFFSLVWDTLFGTVVFLGDGDGFFGGDIGAARRALDQRISFDLLGSISIAIEDLHFAPHSQIRRYSHYAKLIQF
jgi:hypothetical protein